MIPLQNLKIYYLNILHISIHILLILVLVACKGEERTEKTITWTTEQSTNLNKDLAEEEEIDIKLFLAQHGDWKMTKTGSGLRYFIYEDVAGEVASVGDAVQIEFAITLLDGTECYKTEIDEVQEMVVDKSDVETGLQEALKFMSEGDKAKVIIPSHLAHGLLGDMNKIPPLTPLVIDLQLYKILR